MRGQPPRAVKQRPRSDLFTVLAHVVLTAALTVNIATGRKATVREALGYMLEADGYKDAKVVFDASKPTMIPKRLLDTSKAKRLLGFEAKTPFAEGIAKTVAWYRKSRGL